MTDKWCEVEGSCRSASENWCYRAESQSVQVGLCTGVLDPILLNKYCKCKLTYESSAYI